MTKSKTQDYIKVTENIITTPVYHKNLGKNGPPDVTTNMTCIALPEELVFVDCGVDGNFVEKFRKDMEERFQRKTSHLLLTHNHGDHIFGMGVFEDVKIVLAEIGIERLKVQWEDDTETFKKNREEWAKEAEKQDKELAKTIRNAKLFLPNVSVKEELTIGPKEQELLYKVVGGHSPDSAYIYSATEQTIITGDNLLTCYAQVIPDPNKTLEIYRHWETLAIEKVVPGHGEVVKKDYITRARTYAEELFEALKELKKQQVALEEVPKHPSLPEYFDKSEEHWLEGGRCHNEWVNYIVAEWYKKIVG